MYIYLWNFAFNHYLNLFNDFTVTKIFELQLFPFKKVYVIYNFKQYEFMII